MARDPMIYPVDTSTPTGVAVGAVTTPVLAANRLRVSATFVNDSVQTIYLAEGVAAVIGSGIRLNANGGSYTINRDNLFLGAVNAICALGAANLAVSEGV